MRIEIAAKNSWFAMLSQVLNIALKVVNQIVLVRILSVEYLGINGLFSNILTMLSLAELGIGSAILFNMYKPMASNDIKRIKALMNFYKEMYLKIGVTVLVLGVSFTPFIGLVIKDMPNIPEIHIIYILYVVNNAISYFFIYKQSVFLADQKNYVLLKINMLKNTLISVLQIISLLIFKNFLVYLIISIILTMIFNLISSIMADRHYSYLIHNDEKLVSTEKKSIYKDIYAMMAHKVGGVIVLGTDNLLLSKYVGLEAVGFYSNYILIINAVKGFLNQVYEALVSSIGALVNTEDDDRVFEVYKSLFFISFWITTVVSITFFCISSPFVEIAYGEKYLLSEEIVAMMTINFYITDLAGMRAITNKFKTAKGLFWHDRYKPYVESVINLTVSILLLKKLGFVGILLGTLASTIFTGFWVEPFVLFKYGFNIKLNNYFRIYLKYFAVFILAWFISAQVTNSSINIFAKVIIGGFSGVVIPSVIISLLFYRTKEYKYLILIIKKVLGKERTV